MPDAGTSTAQTDPASQVSLPCVLRDRRASSADPDSPALGCSQGPASQAVSSSATERRCRWWRKAWYGSGVRRLALLIVLGCALGVAAPAAQAEPPTSHEILTERP